jgi:hypothetical protein
MGLIKTIWLFYNHLDGKVRTPQFTEFTADAILRAGSHDFVGIIKFQNLFGAEVNADTASLAPFPVDDVLFEFGFCHVGSLEISTRAANTGSHNSISSYYQYVKRQSRAG